jgi:hypothetical protein
MAENKDYMLSPEAMITVNKIVTFWMTAKEGEVITCSSQGCHIIIVKVKGDA